MLWTWITQALQNHLLFTSLIAWLTAECVKVVIRFIKMGRQPFRKLWGSGGMPSAHSATVSSLAVSVGLFHGFDGYAFAIAAILTLVVMYDACGVRLAAGKHAKAINELKNDDEKSLRESLGHTRIEVVAGAVLGSLVALAAYFIIS